MTAALDSTASLAMLYERFKIPIKDREILTKSYGIGSVQQLLDKRNEITGFGSGSTSYERTRRYLWYSIIYLLQGGQTQRCVRFEVLVSNIGNMDPKWRNLIQSGLIHGLEPKENKEEGHTLEKKQRVAYTAMTVKVKDPCRVAPTVKLETSFDEELWDGNTHSLRKRLGIENKESPWNLDIAEWVIINADKPDLIRIPVPLFAGLYPYQKIGVDWLVKLYNNGTGGILGDEMGMGKTRQTLTFLLSMMHAGTLRNAVVVCPTSVLEPTWVKEVKKLLQFFGRTHSIRLEVVSSDQKLKERSGLLRIAKRSSRSKPTLVITTYPIVQTKDLLAAFRPFRNDFFEYLALEEGHRVKNKKTLIYQNLVKICKKSNVLALNGTPIVNNPRELYNLLDLVIGARVVPKWETFRDRYVKPIEKALQSNATNTTLERGPKALQALQALIRPFMLKRGKDKYLGHLLPPNHEYDIWTKPASEQRKVYQEYAESYSATVNRAKDGNQGCVLPVIRKLRMIANHPLLAHEDYMAHLKATNNVDSAIRMSPKLDVIVDLVQKWCDKGLRVLVFSESTKNLDIIEHVMSVDRRGHGKGPILEDSIDLKVCRIDGSTNQKRRNILLEDFNSKESMFNVMLLSIKAGGEGLTLVGAGRSIIYDPPWNQATSDQAVARISRLGQTRVSSLVDCWNCRRKDVWKTSLQRLPRSHRPQQH